ncbi:MAG: UDP-N-acetylglucosamine pyrophosphorylase [Clostridia bacterium]|nr:UDP-N-acetylglucosamine pyrophosphorylase [Clostridia bacterium]
MSLTNKEQLKISELYGYPEHSVASPLLARFTYPWEALASISSFILELGQTLSSELYEKRGEDVWVAKSARVAPTAHLAGPTIICEGAEIRHCAFIRGSAIVGAGAVVGNSTELKNCILFDGVQVPHFNYVGDSILGYKAHMGAGSVTSNVKSDKTPVTVMLDGERIHTGCKKMGAMLGDFVEVGCNSVLNPGTVVGCRSNVYPLSSVRGFVPSDSIYKAQGAVVPKRQA